MRTSKRYLIVLGAVVACSTFVMLLRAAAAQDAPATAPRTLQHGGNLSGVWRNDAAQYPEDVRRVQIYAFSPQLPPLTPWAQEKLAAAKPTFGPKNVAVAETNDPVYKCFPPGTPRIYFHPFPVEIIQTPGRVLMVFEYDHTVRQIVTDGSGHRDDLPASWMGDSIGRWEGDTLVVETVNFNDQTWIDRQGVPHSDQLKVIERIRRPTPTTLEVDITIEDPVAFTRPWKGQRFYRQADFTIVEMSCMDNFTFAEYEKTILKHGATP
jgi:hypothetical protein